MARLWTLQEMTARARSEADMINSTFVTDQEIQNWINSNLCEVYDLLVQAGPPDYYSITFPFSTTAGVTSYALPANFRSMTCLYAVENVDYRRPVREISDYERAKFRPPQNIYNVEMEYVPAPPILENPADTFDGVSGWEELIVAMTARDMLMKEESDVSMMQARIDRLHGRIRTASSQRGAGPRYITDVTLSDIWLYPFTTLIRGCRIRGDNIELYEPVIPFWQ